MVKAIAAQRPNEVAITAPGRIPLTYRGLSLHLIELGRTFNALGIGRRDRVALVIPEGPELAVTAVAAAAAATCVPLPLSCSVGEYEFYLTDVRAKAVVVSAGADSPVRTAAIRCGVSLFEVDARRDGPAGLIAVEHAVRVGPPCDATVSPDDPLVIFYTSGTTGRAKKVPVSHAQVGVRLRSLVDTLALTEQDCCLNLMPVCYYAGFANVLGALASGGSVVCAESADPDAFFAALDECGASWYSAGPTVHQAILARAAAHARIIDRRPLRFVRSGTAALPPSLRTDLEHVFRAPVVVTYGMTEAGIISSSPLPPVRWKPGAVGIVDRAHVTIIDDAGHTLPAGAVGEVAVRGPNVFEGYEDQPEATAAAFVNGWFRTGDQGTIDADGFLSIRGRIKEVINRGGSKVAPQDVEEVLAGHPAVQDAAVFAVSHPTLGEDIAAAVVLRSGARATAAELQEFAAMRLSPFKVPRQMLIVSSLPTGPTGKVQRSALADRVAAALRPHGAAPVTDVEQTIATVWSRVLGVRDVGVHDNFFALGGDSLAAARVLTEIESVLGHTLPQAALWQAPTIAQLAELIARQERGQRRWPSLVAIRRDGSRPPLFCAHAIDGTTSWLQLLTPCLGADQPLYAFHSRGLDGVSMPCTRTEEMAANYIAEMMVMAPTGPYLLCGYSYGGKVAFEMARQLCAKGERVALLALLDPIFVVVGPFPGSTAPDLPPVGVRAQYHLGRLFRYGVRTELRCVAARFSKRPRPTPPPDPDVRGVNRVEVANLLAARASRAYAPGSYPYPVTLILPRDETPESRYHRLWTWKMLTRNRVDVYEVPGDHLTLPSAAPGAIAQVLRTAMDRAIRTSGISDFPHATRLTAQKTWATAKPASGAEAQPDVPRTGRT